MGDLRPLGSEKLQGMDKINRILEIAKYKETPKQNINELDTTNYTVQLADGLTYGIVKEKSGYIIKKGLNESTLDYADPMRQRKYFRSYSEAMKKLNLTAAELNRVYENEEGISLIGEQAGQKKKFVLKLPKGGNKTPDVGNDPMSATPPPPADTATPPPADTATPPPADTATPPMDSTSTGGEMGGSPMDTGMGGSATDTGMGTPPEGDMGGEPTDTGMGTPPEGDMGGEESAPSEDDFDLGGEEGEQRAPSFKSIQRLTGKLSQRLRSIEKDKSLESDDIKYVLNSIISALNLDNLDEDDRDDILSKFDEEEVDYGAEGEGELDMSSEDNFDMGGDEMSDMGETPQPTDTEPKETYSMYGESRVEKVLSKYFDIKPEEKTILEEKRKKEYLKNQLQKINLKKEIREMSESVTQMQVGYKLLDENAKFLGKTNKENLVFIKNGKQIKVTVRGHVL